MSLSPGPMFVIDPSGLIVMANDAAGELLGYTAGEIIGKPFDTLLPGYNPKATIRGREHAKASARASRQPNAASERARALHHSGLEIPVEVTASPIQQDDCAWIVCHVHDLSKQVAVEDHLRRTIEDLDQRLRKTESEARRTHEHFKLLLKYAPVSIVLFDRQMRYLIVSDRFLKDYGLGNRDIHGLCHYDVFPELPAALREMHQRCLNGETITQEEYLFQHADGRTDWTHWEMHPWHTGNNKIGGLLFFSELITPRKQAEIDLLKSYQQLELRVAERTADLAASKDEADRANAQKSWFVAAASHDLRQPLQASLAYMSVLQRKIQNPEHQELCEKSRQPLHAMSDILDVLLDISDLESGRVKPRREDFFIGELIARVVGNAQHQAQEKGLRLSYLPTDIAVHSDPKLLERIITNFVTNAIRYTVKGLIGIYCEKKDANVVVSITDTGIGIPADAIATIFEDHVQLGNPARDRRKGLGLGLSIAKRIADSLGHRIFVQSELGAGSSFSIELPGAEAIAPSRSAPLSANELSPPRSRNPIVLLIDDDQDVADAMQMLLQSYDFETYMANGAQAAMAMLEAGLTPGLVLCDYRLPGTNGIEVIRAIRDFFRAEVPTILLTGDTGLQQMPDDVANCALLHKPVDIDAFFATLTTLDGLSSEPCAVAS